MKKFIVCLLFGMIPLLLPAQQNQSAQKSDSEIEDLKKKVLKLEKQLQTVENVEKMDLQAKLAEANAKLANTEFGKFERELRDSNNEWLRAWSTWFLVIIGVFVTIFIGVGAVFWFWLRSTADRLIADEVKKNLNGFKEAVEAQDLIKNQLRELEKEYATSILRNYASFRLDEEDFHPEEIKVFRDETLLEIFADKKHDTVFRYRMAEILAARKSLQLVSPALELLNSVVDSDSDIDYEEELYLPGYVTLFTKIYTIEAYQGLREFLNRLLTENPKHKDLFLTETVFSLAWVSIKLNIKDSVPILRMAIPYLQIRQQEHQAIKNLARYFDIFNEPAGIKEILTQHVTDGMTEVENKCLELLQKHDPEFVKKWRIRETTDNSTE